MTVWRARVHATAGVRGAARVRATGEGVYGRRGCMQGERVRVTGEDRGRGGRKEMRHVRISLQRTSCIRWGTGAMTVRWKRARPAQLSCKRA